MLKRRPWSATLPKTQPSKWTDPDADAPSEEELRRIASKHGVQLAAYQTPKQKKVAVPVSTPKGPRLGGATVTTSFNTSIDHSNDHTSSFRSAGTHKNLAAAPCTPVQKRLPANVTKGRSTSDLRRSLAPSGVLLSSNASGGLTRRDAWPDEETVEELFVARCVNAKCKRAHRSLRQLIAMRRSFRACVGSLL